MNKKAFQAVLSSRESDREPFSIGDCYVTQYENSQGNPSPRLTSFKKLLKEAWKIASSIFKMAVKFSYEKYTCSGENSSRTSTVWCEQLCKSCGQSGGIFRKFKRLYMEKPQDIQLEEWQIL